jgi:hypothetical protein
MSYTEPSTIIAEMKQLDKERAEALNVLESLLK